jgi:[protein-PII] uridylyltransferase
MSSGFGLKPWIIEARRTWEEGRRRLQALHDQGSSGQNIANNFSDLVDRVILFLYESALKELASSGCDIHDRLALVMLGGCGRREVVPFSDVDLMVLYRGALDGPIEEFARQFHQAIVDTRFPLGFSLRAPRQACSTALGDAAVFSSLTESRFLAGNLDLFENYFIRLKRIVSRRTTYLIRLIIKAREEERTRFGENVYLLRPNVKKSRGSLRDIHLVRWLGFIRFGMTDLDLLYREGYLTTFDFNRLKAANEFLLRVRIELHFGAGRANDMFGKNEQVRIASKWGYTGSEVMLPVEQLMRAYFFHSSEVRYASDQVVRASTTRRSVTWRMYGPLLAQPLEDVYFISPFEIGIRPEALNDVKKDVARVLRLMHLSAVHSREVDWDTWKAIRQAMVEAGDIECSTGIGQQFMALLRNPSRLGDILHRLAEMRILEKIIPEFEHARSLMQFNEYHQYTVDEHSLLAVEKAAQFENDRGPLGDNYRSLRDKSILHLALLIHDLGKGYKEEHCEVGRRLAAEICPRLGLGPEDSDDIKFLVHNHLMMSHTAFQRDINDRQLVAEFAGNVGNEYLLKMLYLLTCADILAVGPGTLNQWKFGLLTSLFKSASALLAGLHKTEDVDSVDDAEWAIFREMAPDDATACWLMRQARSLPAEFYRKHSPETIIGQLLELSRTEGYKAGCWINYDPETKMFELCIGRRVKRRSGIYYRITGMLAGEGQRIRTADIKHLDDSFVWYWFEFEDPSLAGTPSAQRLIELRNKAVQLAEGKEQAEPAFPQFWKDDPSRSAALPKPPVKVTIDNQVVEWATVIDVFAWYKLGLLYRISRRIFELGLDVRFARIAEFGMQVIQVFYVTDENGDKVTSGRQLVLIRRAILNEVQEFLEPDRKKTE